MNQLVLTGRNIILVHDVAESGSDKIRDDREQIKKGHGEFVVSQNVKFKPKAEIVIGYMEIEYEAKQVDSAVVGGRPGTVLAKVPKIQTLRLVVSADELAGHIQSLTNTLGDLMALEGPDGVDEPVSETSTIIRP